MKRKMTKEERSKLIGDHMEDRTKMLEWFGGLDDSDLANLVTLMQTLASSAGTRPIAKLANFAFVHCLLNG